MTIEVKPYFGHPQDRMEEEINLHSNSTYLGILHRHLVYPRRKRGVESMHLDNLLLRSFVIPGSVIEQAAKL